MMKPNKTYGRFLPAITVAALLSANGYAASDTATITISGRVLANTCTIDTASAAQNIVLADIADRDIKGKGTTGGEKIISIVLKNCGAGASSVVVTASGTKDKNDTTAFANVSGSGSEGVGLYFWQTNGTTKFLPDGSRQETSSLTRSADTTLTYKTAYVGTRESVKAGAFSTVVNIKFDYQ